MNIKFASAVERAQQSPGSFSNPVGDDLVSINPGDFVKVCVEEFDGQRAGERFWVEVTHIEGGEITGAVANTLLHVPLNEGARVTFGKGNIFQVQSKDALVQIPPPAVLLTRDEAWLVVDVAVRGTDAGRGDEFKAILQRLSNEVGYEPPVSPEAR